jgi:hypothetical protein
MGREGTAETEERFPTLRFISNFNSRARNGGKLTTVGIAGVVRQHFSVTVLFGVHAALVAVAWAVISLKMPARVPVGKKEASFKKKEENCCRQALLAYFCF